MAFVLLCSCGYTIRGGTEDEFFADAFQHVKSAHPDMADTITREGLLAMAQVE